MKKILCFIVLLVLISCSSEKSSKQQQYNYPKTYASNVSDNYFNINIKDPYRWLEDTTSLTVNNWVSEQNAFTNAYFNKISYYNRIYKRLEQLYNSPLNLTKHYISDKLYYLERQTEDRYNYIPSEKSYFSSNNKIYLNNQVFLDIDKLYPYDNIKIKNIKITDDKNYLIFQLTRNGGDLSEIHILDIINGRELETLNNTTGNFYIHDNGFFYITPSKVVNPLLSLYNYQKLNYHLINSKTINDKNIYMGDNSQNIYFLYQNDDKGYFVVTKNNNGSMYEFSLSNPLPIRKIIENNASYFVLGSYNTNTLTIMTNGAQKYKLINLDLNTLSTTDLLPQDNSKIMNNVVRCNNKYYAQMLVNGASELEVYSNLGQFENKITLPGQGNIALYCNNNTLNYDYSNLIIPRQRFEYNYITQVSNKIAEDKFANYDSNNYTTEEIFVPSGDANVSIFLAYKKGIKLDGSNPAYIYAYGGFNVEILLSFAIGNVAFMENGGIYVLAQVRGGSEYGTKWYDMGRLFNKQNTYNDIIAVAQYLIKHKYTSANKLALGGRSNGGLTAAIVALQRPELFQVALPAVGVHDLLRYQNFTYGYLWSYNYGLSTIYDQFNNMLGFSPLQNIKSKSYPAMYIQTGQLDTRVPPFHSYKLAATLQNTALENPYLLDSFTNLNHFYGNNKTEIVAKELSFIFYNTHSLK